MIYILVFGWLRVAEILNNPFGNNALYDINLATLLDLNIWKSSLLLENQETFHDTNFAEYVVINDDDFDHNTKNSSETDPGLNDVSISV